MSTPVARTASGFYSRTRASSIPGGSRVSQSSRRHDIPTATLPATRTPSLANGTVQPRRSFGTYAPGMLLEEQELNLSGGSDLEDADLISPSESPERTMPPQSFPAPARIVAQSHDYSQVISLLQQQQTVLQQVLSGQQSLDKRQDHVESEILRLQSNFNTLHDSTLSSSGDSGSDRKRKRVVTRDLSVSSTCTCIMCIIQYGNTVYRRDCGGIYFFSDKTGNVEH